MTTADEFNKLADEHHERLDWCDDCEIGEVKRTEAALREAATLAAMVDDVHKRELHHFETENENAEIKREMHRLRRESAERGAEVKVLATELERERDAHTQTRKQLERRLADVGSERDRLGDLFAEAETKLARHSQLIRVTHDDGDLDEFVARNVNMHFERMDVGEWWCGVDFDNGDHWALSFGAINPRAKVYGRAEKNP